MPPTTNNFSFPFYEQVLDFLAQSPSAQELVNFRPSPDAQQRFSALLEQNREGTLSTQEEEELDHYILIERMMTLLKAKAFRHLALSLPQLPGA